MKIFEPKIDLDPWSASKNRGQRARTDSLKVCNVGLHWPAGQVICTKATKEFVGRTGSLDLHIGYKGWQTLSLIGSCGILLGLFSIGFLNFMAIAAIDPISSKYLWHFGL